MSNFESRKKASKNEKLIKVITTKKERK